MSIFKQVILGIILGEFLATMFHWFEDAYLAYLLDIPILSHIAITNELHHYLPYAITSSSFLYLNLTTFGIISCIYIILFVFFWNHFVKYYTLWICAALMGIFSTWHHQQTHERDCKKPFIVKLLHKIPILIVNSNIHKRHHAEDTGRNYAPTLHPLNMILDGVNFYRVLECLIYKLTGISTRHLKLYGEYVHTDVHRAIELNFCPEHVDIETIECMKGYLKRLI